MATTKRVTPGRKGYKILFAENKVIMNKKFAAAAAEYGTDQNTIIRDIRTDFPGMKEVVVSGRECDKAKPNHRLTYKNMETYIGVYENAHELLEVFKRVKAMSKAAASPYKYVSDWFKMQFPDYKAVPTYEGGKLAVAVMKPPKVEEYTANLSDAA
jgi:hypothetical protein